MTKPHQRLPGQIKGLLFALLVLFPPTFAGFHLFMFAVWLYWPIEPVLVLLCAPVFIFTLAWRLGHHLGFHSPFREPRPRAIPIAMPKCPTRLGLLEIGLWWLVIAVAWLHLIDRFHTSVTHPPILLLPVGYAAYFASAILVGPALVVLSRPLRALARDLWHLRSAVQRLAAVAIVLFGADLFFAAFYRVVSLTNRAAFRPSMSSFSTAFALSTDVISVAGTNSVPATPKSHLVQYGVSVETIVGLLLIGAVLAFVIAIGGSSPPGSSANNRADADETAGTAALLEKRSITKD